MKTYRERREARAERLREWAEKREEKATLKYNAASEYIEQVPLGQPILVGHHSEKRHRNAIDKFNRDMTASHEHRDKAAAMRQRADNIERAADNAIYSDDPDAIERLRKKITDAERLRQGVKDYNASVRRGSPDESVLSDKMRLNLHELQGMRGMMRPDGQLPTYLTSNLSGNINRMKKRLVGLEKKRANEDSSPVSR